MSIFRSGNIIPQLVKNILIINVLLYLGSQLLMSRGIDLYNILILFYFESDHFLPHQLVTHMFMHANTWHLFFNMFALWMFGTNLERFWGPRRFLIFYMVTGLGAALMHMGFIYYQLQTGDINYYPAMLGASGAVYGVLAAFTMYWPNTRLFIMFIPVPIKAKYAVLFMVILELTLGFGNFSWDNIAHFAHLGGALVGFILVKIWNKTNRNSLY